LHVSRLYIYPLKSARGISVDTLALDSLGPRWDRRWMLIDEHGRFISQREVPRLSLISTALCNDRLAVSAPDRELFTVPTPGPGVPRIKAEIWDDVVDVVPVGAGSDEWFSDALMTHCRLVYFPEDSIREVEQTFNPEDKLVGLADGFPLLVIGEASLRDLNERLVARQRDPLPMNRFRPNLVIEGAPPFAEDSWQNIHVGTDPGVGLSIVKPCARCAITTVDQRTGIRGKEPLATLATFRRGPDGSVFFGQNAIHDRPGTIRRGDPVHISSGTTSEEPSPRWLRCHVDSARITH